MNRKNVWAIALVLIGAVTILSAGTLDGCQPIDRKQLREIMAQLGFEVKDIVTDPGKEKYSVTITRDGLDIPIGSEISPNGKFIWLTVNLGPAQPDNTVRSFSLLKQNGIAQPCQFYVTSSGTLMMGLPVENRGITNAMLRERLESIASRVGESKSIWQ